MKDDSTLDTTNLPRLDLQSKTRVKEEGSTLEFSSGTRMGKQFNELCFCLPLEEFYSELEQNPDDISPEIFIEFDAPNYTQDKIEEIAVKENDLGNGSVYIGDSHNPIDVLEWDLKKISKDTYYLKGKVKILFSLEGVAQDEEFIIETNVKLI